VFIEEKVDQFFLSSMNNKKWVKHNKKEKKQGEQSDVIQIDVLMFSHTL
jgi:hypothetical protein